VRRRARRGGLARARGAVLTLGWRFTSMPTDGLGGATHGVDVLVHPFARLRGPWRFARLTVGGEVALRLARPDTVDTTTWAVLGMGAQWPGRWFTPYATLLVQAGVGTRYRFLTTIAEPAVLVGLEAGTDLRLVGFAGVNVGLGVGRAQVGSQWSYAAWLRASVALF
jgi:hypothetical protein